MPLSESVLLLMALLAIGVLVRGLFNKLPIPYSVMLVILGMLLGNLARVWQPLESIRYFQLSPELVFFIFLPVLIFESGLSLHARQLAKDIVPVLMLAIPALLLSTTIVGVGVWLLLPLDLTTALLFGALISATDPVAVVSLFKELGTPTRLTTLVEGESLLNDATAIVLSIPADLPGRDILLNLTLGVVLLSLLINAPTIRLLIERLGLDRLSEDESIELEQAAAQMRAHAGSVLQKLLDNRVLSRAGNFRAEQEVSQSLQWPMQDVSDESFKRKQHLNALREESRELERLFNAGVVPQYSFLDIKVELQRERDQLRNPERVEGEMGASSESLFIRFENALIRRLRESNWASNLLARYQNTRISQHVVKDLVRILMAEAAIEYARQQSKIDPRFDPSIVSQYRDRLRLLHDRIADYQRDFEEFYQRFEGRFAKRAVLISVLRYIQNEQRKGVVSTKVYAVLAQAISHALDFIPAISEPVPGMKNEDLIGLVPLFVGLSDDALKGIAAKVASVNYLPGDIIIGQGEHGDSLYIVVKGRVRVSHTVDEETHVLADLVVGDFFGEMALLGDHVRRATVTAQHTSTLLRLTAQDVMEISRQFPEIGEYLNELKQDREGGLDHQS
ncbi:MAG: cyclic nucleotide-binding domain-containing protein [Gammaproteobacteria bacterium]|nr:cyclic nucleotide-binding domain-containing protein [Gammaproteobacteria bacterium]